MGEKKHFDPTDYKNKFAKENYERVIFVVKKGEKDLIKEFAKERHVSVNQFIKDALSIAYDLNLS